MKNKKKLLLITGILLLVIGVSFAYYVMHTSVTGSGSEVDAVTKEINDVEIKIEGNLTFNDKDILPGHKNVSSIKLTATGDDKEVYYDLVWDGKNTLSTPLNYTVYRVDTKQNVSMTCTDKEQYLIGEIRYFEDCVMTNENTLGKSIATGTIDITNENTKVVLKRQESIVAPTNGNKEIYYYVVLEFPNIAGEQIQVENGTFSGKVTVEPALKPTPTEKILANMTNIVEEDPLKDFGAVAITETEGVIYEKVVGNEPALTNNTSSKTKATLLSDIKDKKTYYFSGAPKDNYVIFADHYWRIIRINENGSIRMIYSGNVNTIGSKKEIVLANGYDDSTYKYTSYTTSAFNEYTNDNAYVGFKYEKGKLHGILNNSNILNILTNWYQNYIVNKGYDEYIDIDAGFCGDRTAYSNKEGTKTGTGINGDVTYYGSYIRNYTNKTPIFYCPDSNDLYKTKVGLITADEVAYAGGVYYTENKNYYLYTGYRYWTISPSYYDSNAEESINARLVDVNEDGGMGYGNTYDSGESVRPVINLKSAVTLTGAGTIKDPYTVSLK